MQQTFINVNRLLPFNELHFAAADFDLFPNPASGSFQVKYTGKNTGTFQLHLTDMLGREQLVNVFHNDAAIDISPLPAGIYFVRILHKGVLLQTKKLAVAAPR